jgi:putative DNA primase/helicase
MKITESTPAPTNQMNAEILDSKAFNEKCESQMFERFSAIEGLQVSSSNLSKMRGWDPITPFNYSLSSQNPFPLSSLPKVIKEAVEEVHAHFQTPIPLVVSASLVPLAAPLQRLVDVARNSKLRSPVSIFSLVLAKSGERKSSVDREFSKPLYDYQQERAVENKRIESNYLAKLSVWEREETQIRERITSAGSGSIEPKTLESQLESHLSLRPEPPRTGAMMLDDITPEALLVHMAEKCTNVVLHSSEGGSFFGSRQMSPDKALQSLAAMNKFWDGSEVRLDRKEAKSSCVSNGRLSISLAVQPAVFAEFQNRSKNICRDIGFLSRCLMCFPESTQGTRMYREPSETSPKLTRYHELIRFLLILGEAKNDLELRVVPISSQAMPIWTDYLNKIEARCADGEIYCDTSDFASKSADHATRLACIFAFANNLGPVDSLDEISMKQGCEVAEWYLNASVRIFDGLNSYHEFQDLKRALLFLLQNKHQDSKRATRTSSCGPNCRAMRPRPRLDEIINIFTERNIARFKDATKSVIEVNPILFEVDEPLKMVGLLQ